MGTFDYAEEEIKQYKKLAASANYQLCNVFLPMAFFLKPEAFAKAIVRKELAVKLLSFLSEEMKNEKIDVESLFANMGCYAKVDKQRRIAALIIRLPNPTMEPECNYVATVFFDMEPKYFESELYKSGKFGLCGRDKDGNHINYGFPCDSIETIDDL